MYRSFGRLMPLILLSAIAMAANATPPSFQATPGAAGTISGTATDSTGAVIPNAQVEIKNPVSGYDRTCVTDGQGNYQFTNVPFGNYHATIQAAGFAPGVQDVTVRSSLPVNLPWTLSVAAATQTVTVQSDAADMVQNTSTSSTAVDNTLIQQVPTAASSSGLSDVITLASPGVVQDSNGMFHPEGEHADTTFSIDGQPISDQQSRAFSNEVALGTVQSLNVISGVAPAEYGDKASLVVQTTTKSGLGTGKPHGSVAGSYGTFGTSTADASVGVGSQHYGAFAAFDGMNSGRFLDTPEFVPLHAHGNDESLFLRLDAQPNGKDSAHINLTASRSWAQNPNQYDQQAAGQDQRQQIKSFNIAPSYTHLFSTTTLLSADMWVRQDQVHYYPSSNLFHDTPATLAQNRRLTNLGVKVDLSWDKGISSFKGGGVFQHTPLDESFSLGITSPFYNAPCLSANGAPLAGGSLPCSAGEVPNPNYQPGEASYDLTRGGRLFQFQGTTDVKECAATTTTASAPGPWSSRVWAPPTTSPAPAPCCG
jgi:hypothetical protein